MSYRTTEKALLDVIRILGNYNTSNSSQGDYKVLRRGVKRAAVLQPGGLFDQRRVAQATRRMRTPWIIRVELLLPSGTSTETIPVRMRDDMQELVDHIDKYPRLNQPSDAEVVTATVRTIGEPVMYLRGNSRWWRQDIGVHVEERASVTIAE